jgi:hypothetical protein
MNRFDVMLLMAFRTGSPLAQSFGCDAARILADSFCAEELGLDRKPANETAAWFGQFSQALTNHVSYNDLLLQDEEATLYLMRNIAATLGTVLCDSSRSSVWVTGKFPYAHLEFCESLVVEKDGKQTNSNGFRLPLAPLVVSTMQLFETRKAPRFDLVFKRLAIRPIRED